MGSGASVAAYLEKTAFIEETESIASTTFPWLPELPYAPQLPSRLIDSLNLELIRDMEPPPRRNMGLYAIQE